MLDSEPGRFEVLEPGAGPAGGDANVLVVHRVVRQRTLGKRGRDTPGRLIEFEDREENLVRMLVRAVGSDVLIPIGTLILGYAGSLLTESRRDRRVEKRERAARGAEFQRPTLLALQETLHAFLRTQMEVIAAVDAEYERSGTPWREIRWPDELVEADRVARSKAYMLRVRVKDDQLGEGKLEA